MKTIVPGEQVFDAWDFGWTEGGRDLRVLSELAHTRGDELLTLINRSRMVATTEEVWRTIEGIVSHAKTANPQIGVTGFLEYAKRQHTVVQTLEGAVSAVHDVFSKICRDPRHTDMQVMSCGIVECRSFEGWAMQAVDSEDETLCKMEIVGNLHNSAAQELIILVDDIHKRESIAGTFVVDPVGGAFEHVMEGKKSAVLDVWHELGCPHIKRLHPIPSVSIHTSCSLQNLRRSDARSSWQRQRRASCRTGVSALQSESPH